MNRRLKNILYSAAVILLLVAAVSYEQAFFNELSNQNISKQAQRYITEKSAQIDLQVESIANDLTHNKNLWLEETSEDFLIYVTTKNKVEYWNSNRISPEDIPFSSKLSCKKIDNAWFLYKSYSIYHYRIDVLANIKNNYAISNDFFQNDDADQSQLSQYSISEEPQLGYNPVLGDNNKPIFYFSKTELNEHNRRHSLLASILYIALFLAFLLLLSNWHRSDYINLLSVVVFGFSAISIISFYDIIPIFGKTEIFINSISLAGDTTSSLGMLSLYCIFWVVFCFTVSRQIAPFKAKRIKALAITTLLILSLYLIIQTYLQILNNTSINLQLYRIRYINYESFWVYSILSIFIAGWGRLANTTLKSFRTHKWVYVYPVLAGLICWIVFDKNPLGLCACVIFVAVVLFSLRRKRKVVEQYLFIHLLVASVLLSFMMTILTERESNQKNDNDKIALIQTLPATLLFERDYTIEEHLLDIWGAMQEDHTLRTLPTMVFDAADYYAKYLRISYFSDLLQKYDMQVVVCSPENLLKIDGLGISPNCYSFFENRLRNQGEQIKNTGFYWQKNNNGRVSYFGWLKISEGTMMETSIFIELESPIVTEGDGYPEMLKDKSSITNVMPSKYSFARYAKGRLITSSGDFRFPPSNKWIREFKGEIHSMDFDKYTHLFYRVAEDNVIVLTEDKRPILFPVYAYIYNFLFFYVAFLLVHLLSKKHRIKFNHSISNDIRFTIFGILFLSLILVGTTSILFPLNVYKQNQENAITDKAESFLNSLSRELSEVSDIREVTQYSLTGLVQALSNTLSVDIHIYDLEGRLYASSRPQLFNYKLQGNIICPKAFHAFKYENKTSKVHEELIGNNEYRSSYYIVSNAREEPIAYINVPFFSSQEDLKKSLTDFVVLLLNIYLILIILVITFTFFSVNAITKPLLLMQEGLSKMRLGSNEKIVYNRDDEIGNLVDKYNVMVDKLNASVEQLAKTEREVAWQSMARQIAHEIKNPLTPMKLSIQHLARTKSVAPEVFDDYFNKTAHTLIEQIDNLSNIASSFSSFAKITDGTPEIFSISERLSNVVFLFAQSGSTVNFDRSKEDFNVKMDKDHFIQVLNNLIKNALQAIPKEREGQIDIWTIKEDSNVIINVKDNGSGIDKNTLDKIFQPNFTTKNSGMGLGLAISQKMINNTGGNISVSSTSDEGTIFKIQLPINKDE